MANYLVIASDLPPLEGPKMPARTVFELMQKHSCWEFPVVSQQAKLKADDQLFFYLGGKTQSILGEATVNGKAIPIEKSSPKTFDRNLFPFFAWRLPLRDFIVYPTSNANLDLLMSLSFAKNSTVTRPYVGLLLRVGLRSLTEDDAALIRRFANSPSTAGSGV